MKTLFLALILVFVSGCTSQTQFGQCIGAFDDKDPKLVYKMDGWNIVWAIVGAEFIAPPVIVLVNETLCPVARK